MIENFTPHTGPALWCVQWDATDLNVACGPCLVLGWSLRGGELVPVVLPLHGRPQLASGDVTVYLDRDEAQMDLEPPDAGTEPPEPSPTSPRP